MISIPTEFNFISFRTILALFAIPILIPGPLLFSILLFSMIGAPSSPTQ